MLAFAVPTKCTSCALLLSLLPRLFSLLQPGNMNVDGLLSCETLIVTDLIILMLTLGLTSSLSTCLRATTQTYPTDWIAQ